MALAAPPGGENPSPAYLAGQAHGASLAVQHHAARADTRNATVQTGAGKPHAAPKPAKPASPSGGGTLNDYLRQAQQIAMAQTNAQVAAIKAQQGLYNSQAQAKAQQELAASQAGAKLIADLNLGGQTAASYGTAAQQLAGLAQGFSGQTQTDASNAAAQVQAQLAGLGAPSGSLQTSTGQTSDPAAMGNVLYGLGGFIPGNVLETTGQAQAGAQRELPLSALAYGQAQARGELAAGQQQADSLTQNVINARAQEPSLYQSILSSLGQQMTNQALAESLIGQRAATTTLNTNKFAWTQQQASIDNQIKKYNAYTSRLRATKPSAASTSKPSASITKTINDGYLHLSDGTRALVNGKPVSVPKSNSPSAGGQTASQAKQTAEAYGSARYYHQPWKDSKGVAHPPLRWSAWLTAGLSKGISLQTLMRQGRKIYSPAEIKNDSQPGYVPGG